MTTAWHGFWDKERAAKVLRVVDLVAWNKMLVGNEEDEVSVSPSYGCNMGARELEGRGMITISAGLRTFLLTRMASCTELDARACAANGSVLGVVGVAFQRTSVSTL